MRRPVRKLRLRQRVSLLFGLVALMMSVFLGATTYLLAQHYLWGQRQEGAIRQTNYDARRINDRLNGRPSDIEQQLQRIDALGGQSSTIVLQWGGRWYGSPDQSVRLVSLPVLARAGREAPTTQRIVAHHRPMLLVAVPVRHGLFIELYPLVDLNATLALLRLLLLVMTVITTLFGTLLGWWVTQRAVRPVVALAQAATAVASGDLDRRLDARGDPDLEPVATAFNENTAKLQERLIRDERFAGDVTHELRTPMTAVANAVDLLQARAGSLDPESREVLAILDGYVHRLTGMIEDLLAISRFDAQETTLQVESVPLVALVREVARSSAGRPVRVLDSEEEVQAMVDPRRIERVVDNLVRNAETHGHGLSSITVTSDGSHASLCFDDRGPGVPAEERQVIFDRFVRNPSARARHPGGSGLGLSLVAAQVGMPHGHVWVEDAPTGGARFVVRLPLEIP